MTEQRRNYKFGASVTLMPRKSNPNRGGKREPGPGKKLGSAPAVPNEPATKGISGMVSPREFEDMERLRGSESRSSWIRRAVQEAISAAPEHMDQLPENYPEERALCPWCRAGIGPDDEGQYYCACGWFPGATDEDRNAKDKQDVKDTPTPPS
jgi:hypothetical protein